LSSASVLPAAETELLMLLPRIAMSSAATARAASAAHAASTSALDAASLAAVALVSAAARSRSSVAASSVSSRCRALEATEGREHPADMARC
jgi:hypothetical protein